MMKASGYVLGKSRKTKPLQTSTDEFLAPHDSIYAQQHILSCIHFDDVASCAQTSNASLTTAEENFWPSRIGFFDWGLLRSIWRAAAIPFTDGRPISIRIRSGRSSSAFCTAANPSDTSQRTINSARSLIKDRTFMRKGSEVLYKKNAHKY